MRWSLGEGAVGARDGSYTVMHRPTNTYGMFNYTDMSHMYKYAYFQNAHICLCVPSFDQHRMAKICSHKHLQNILRLLINYRPYVYYVTEQKVRPNRGKRVSLQISSTNADS